MYGTHGGKLIWKGRTALIGNTEKLLLAALKQSLHPGEKNMQRIGKPAGMQDMRSLLALARKHAVLSLLFDVYEDDERISLEFQQELQNAAATVARSNYRLLFLTKYITQLLQKVGIRAILLKGAATASCYPVPELRKSGDVDILIPEEGQFRRAVELLKSEGFAECGEQFALHHIELKNAEGISVEIHRILAEPFESKRMNLYLEQLLPSYEEHVVVNESWGVTFYQPTDAYHAFYLVIHMLQHFLRAGFGLKFLCDWTVFWNREVEEDEKETFRRLVRESKTEGFVIVLTEACVKYLGLKRENVKFLLGGIKEHKESKLAASVELGAFSWQGYDLNKLTEDFMEEVFAAGEFGHDTQQRMVAMRGTGITAYAREFHHQMHLNYPHAGKVFLFWPLLWALTLARFLYNNRTVRKVRGRDILKEAGRRSRLIDRMKLF